MQRRLNSEITLGALLATIFWIGILGWQASYLPTEMEKQACQEMTKKTDRKADDCKNLWEKTTSDPIAFFTFVLAVSTIGLWVATVFLYRAGERQIAVSHTAADAAKKSAEVSERALVDLERAYIFVDNIASDIAEFFSPNLVWTDGRHFPIFSFWAMNLGRTPGNIEFGAIYFDVLSQIPTEMTRLHSVAANADAESVEIIIGADKRFEFARLVCRNGFTHAQVSAMRAGASHLYCHGLFVYRDIFNNSHTTKFCRRYLPARNEWPPDGGRERNSSD